MRTLFIAAMMFSCMVGTYALAGEIKLPEPKKAGGMPLFEAIDSRGSFGQGDIPTGQLTREDLATILWAATGTNRDGAKWTVPMAMGRPPYSKVYVLDDTGSYLYNWKNHSLIELGKTNVKPDIASQGFAKTIPAILIIATDATEIAKFGNNPFGDEFAVVLAGAMSQNIYLASEGVGVAARVVYSIERDKAASLLRLNKGDRPLFAVLLGKR